MLQNILVPLDGSYLSERAGDYAAVLANKWHGSVELFHWAPPGAIERAPAAELEAGLQLDAVATDLRQRGIPVQTTIDHVAHATLAAALRDIAETRSVTCIVMATRGPSGVNETMFGSLAEQAARDVGLPILIVPGTPDQSWSLDREFRILVPLDGSEAGERAIEPARDIAACFGGRLILARIVSSAMEGGDPAALTRATTHARRYIQLVTAELVSSGVPVEQIVDVGEPVNSLVNLAGTERIDLIVQGTHARRGFLRLLQGSVTESIVDQTSVPVLVIPDGARM